MPLLDLPTHPPLRVYLAKWCETLVAVKLLLGSGITPSDMENLKNLEAAAELAVSLSDPTLHNLQREAELMATLRCVCVLWVHACC